MRYLITLSGLLLTFTILTGQSSLILTEIMYNSPGEDIEFLEFYNNGSDTLDLAGYEVVQGVEYAFPQVQLAPQSTFLITNDSLRFNVIYKAFSSEPVSEWRGSLNNGGEQIVILSPEQDTVINLTYNDTAPWPKLPDGFGPSIYLCDPSSDFSDPANWRSNPDLSAELLIQGARIFANPGEVPIVNVNCDFTIPFALSDQRRVHVVEQNDTIELPIYYESSSMTVDTFIAVGAGNLAEGMDYNILSDTLIFEPGQTSPENFVLELLQDNEVEEVELLLVKIFPISDPGNAVYPEGVTTLIVADDDSPITNNVELRGVIENSQVKAIELFAKEELTSQTIYNFALGSANNGNGSDGIEHSLSTLGTIPRQSCWFVANDTVRFKKFFDLADGEVPLLEVDDLNFNGNDAVELFENGQLVDVFGFQDEDGEGTGWEYTDGWAKRKSGGSSIDFGVDDWNYGGVGVLDADLNSNSNNPYPLECIPTSVEEVTTLYQVQLFPNPSSGSFTIRSEKVIKKISIVDMVGRVGRVIHENKIFNTYQQEINLNGVVPGVYFVKYEVGGKFGIQRLVVE